MTRLIAVLLVAGLVVACGDDGGASAVPVVEGGSTVSAGGTSKTTSATEPDADGKTAGPDGKPVPASSSAPSCARVHGGKTCGPDGDQDCCEVAQQGGSRIGKYMITAGRMRTFIEKLDGDIAGFVETLPAGKWKGEWNVEGAIPTDRASAAVALGPSGKKACEQGSFIGRTYWSPKTDVDFSDFDQDVLDEKALNCAPWELMQALCAWDGGHLATVAELEAAFTNGGTTKFPWGDDAIDSVSAPDPEGRLNIEGGFATSPLPKEFRAGEDGLPMEASFLIAPPGRFPKGNNKAGIADSAGNLLEWAGDEPRRFVWKADFEHHGANAAKMNLGSIWMARRTGIPFGVGLGAWIWGESQMFGQAGTPDQKHGYYAIGGRCAF